jgi:hypothetical protein
MNERRGEIGGSLLEQLRSFEESVSSELKRFERKILLWGWGSVLVTTGLAFAAGRFV